MAMMLLFLQAVWIHAQQKDGVEAVMRYCGLSDPESLDSYEVERLADYLQNPLKINFSKVSDLEKSGLFTPFQIASLVDYRSRHGDVLSFTELAALDGFGHETASVLEPFLSLESMVTTGRQRKSLRQDMSVRGGYRGDNSYLYGVKYRIEYGGVCLSASGSRSYSAADGYPEYVTGNISWNHRLGKIVLGDFNARFGQGLCLWNSAVIGGLTSPSAFMRRPSGLSPSFSFTGSSAMTGFAGDINAGRWRLSAMLVLPEGKNIPDEDGELSLMPAVNVSRYGRYGHVSATHAVEFSDCLSPYFRIPQMRTAADASVCIRGVNVFGEVVYDWVGRSVAAVGGTDFNAGEDFRLAALLEYYPSHGTGNEYGCAVSGDLKGGRWVSVGGGKATRRSSLVFSVDASYDTEGKSKDGGRSMQIKSQVSWDFVMTDCLMLKLRVTERFRTWGTAFRTDVRADVGYVSGEWKATMRLNALDCVGTGLLGYVEGGYAGGWLMSYMRVGLFKVDCWDDRIYVYERDAPDSFNVPAYYGRGVWTAFNLNVKLSSWCRLYLRASYVGYPFMSDETRKPGRAELKIQSVFRF